MPMANLPHFLELHCFPQKELLTTTRLPLGKPTLFATVIVKMKVSPLVVTLALAPAAAGFQSPFRRAFAPVSLKATTLNPNGVINGLNGDQNPSTWECDEEANCVEVAACDEVQCRTGLDVRIHGTWYDLSGT